MRVEFLSLRDFRNYAEAEVEFSAGPNLILGRNGQGKTNLVEAIAYFHALKSHRVHTDLPMIRVHQDSAIIRMSVAANQRNVLLETQIHRAGPNKAQINRAPASPRELPRWFSAVVFAPEDLLIIRGEPSVRRKFLDDAVIARNPAATALITEYDRIVKQRNALLKSLRHGGNNAATEHTLYIWNEQLAEHGSRIMQERRLLVRDVQEPLARAYGELIDDDHVPRIELSETVSRETSSSECKGPEGQDVSRETLREQFLYALTHSAERERERGLSLIGPHRDDFELELNGLPVKGFASHGETWSMALSLRLALADVLRNESAAGDPVIILDDVFAELDSGRRDRLMAAVGEYEQVIITAAVQDDVPGADDWNTVVVTAGHARNVSPSQEGGGDETT